MSFKDISVPSSITTGIQDPTKEFFDPILSNAKTYDVAVGYFTSGWLRDAAEGMAHFAKNKGVSRWVISPNLNASDADAISEIRQGEVKEAFYEREIIELIDSLKKHTREELCSLIAAGVLQFRIAIPNKNNGGMFHAKIGVAEDGEDGMIAFSGSYNLTANAKSNWEHFEVFTSFEEGDLKRINRIKERFETLWKNEDPTYKTYKPSTDLVEKIHQKASKKLVQKYREVKIELRGYQEEAIYNWGKNKCCGTYEMATGSGKTITALASIKKLEHIVVEQQKLPLVTIIVLPLIHLLEQWHEEALDFGYDAIKCYDKSEVWSSRLAEQLGALNVSKEGHVIAMVTNKTFSDKKFQDQIKQIKTHFLLVADEAHNLGSASALAKLPENADFRLALSATPERFNDPDGTESLFNYFGKSVIKFDLDDAIKAGYLTPYKYYPHKCLLSQEEYEEYVSLTELIRAESNKRKDKDEFSKEYYSLMGKRVDLISGVNSKLDILKDLIEEQKVDGDISHTLVYCGSRRGENNQRHIERTVKLLGDLGIKNRKFTADESMDERKEILKLFATGELEAIAAIKCLDEGVDVPATRVAYILASTLNPREYIQRRGRVLRKSPGKDFAVIHDFLVAPPANLSGDIEMLERELERAREFSELAMNVDESNLILDQIAVEGGISV